LVEVDLTLLSDSETEADDDEVVLVSVKTAEQATAAAAVAWFDVVSAQQEAEDVAVETGTAMAEFQRLRALRADAAELRAAAAKVDKERIGDSYDKLRGAVGRLNTVDKPALQKLNTALVVALTTLQDHYDLAELVEKVDVEPAVETEAAPAPVVEEVAPVVEEVAPVVEEVAPIVEEAMPVVAAAVPSDVVEGPEEEDAMEEPVQFKGWKPVHPGRVVVGMRKLRSRVVKF
jgi:hypothetical protein